MVVLVLALLGLGLGLGLGFLKIIPRIAVKIIGLLATVALVVMFASLLGLPKVALLSMLTGTKWIYGLLLGYLAGDRLADLF